MATKLSDRNAFAELLERQAEADEELRLDSEDAEALRQKTLEMLENETLKLVDQDGGATTGLLIEIAHDTAALMFAGMEWTLLRAEQAEFVTSDRGMSSFDPTPKHPWSSHGIYSSPNAETYFPISSGAAIMVTPGRPTLHVSEATTSMVAETNLRIYGWANRYVFGRNQEAVARVRRGAKKRPQIAVPPIPRRLVQVIERDPADDRLARAHQARAWPPYMLDTNERGRIEQLDYLVIGEDGNAVEIGINASELVRRRALKAAGYDPDSDVELPGRVEVEPLEPGTIYPSLPQ